MTTLRAYRRSSGAWQLRDTRDGRRVARLPASPFAEHFARLLNSGDLHEVP